LCVFIYNHWSTISNYIIADQQLCRNHILNARVGKNAQTFLHLCAANVACHVDMIRYLLDMGCDASVRDTQQCVPYQVCANKTIRRVFVQFRADSDPVTCTINWNAVCDFTYDYMFTYFYSIDTNTSTSCRRDCRRTS
jgi:hypothetical protein